MCKPINTSKKLNTKKATFTKRLVVFILYISIVWVTWSYILATIALIKNGDPNPLTDVSIEVIRTLLLTILGYLCKSFFETKEEEKTRINEKKLDYMNSINNNIDENYK